ncbi:neuronal acetylcholine receptor subunit beta-4-like [Ostrea edulis]|uniref:neuronal acetylcholine receptor subunit beta-4-like n=1 Tax=Ostrea edulis TaxID=37623 RepID=UPI0024AF8406|nr:neuronal acetylcholine receptor subunit beta-4-like [Ostrea edulis]
MNFNLLIIFWCIPSTLSLNEVDLRRSLLDPAVYDKFVRPRINASHIVNVRIELTSVNVISLASSGNRIPRQDWKDPGWKERESSFSQACILLLNWDDEFLTWNASHYEGVDSFVMDPSFLWTPDVTIFGRMEGNQGVDFSRVQVQSNGSVSTLFSGLLTTHCSSNPAYFPFDYQLCTVKVGSQIYSSLDVFIEITSVKIDKEQEGNPTWDLVDIKLRNTSYGYQEVFFCLRRKPLYLTVLYMAPTTMLAVLVLISYVIPSEAGEKISFGMSLFLSFMVCLLQLIGHLPQVSTSVPALEIYYMLHMVSGVISVVVSSFTAYVIHKTDQSPQSTVTKVKDVAMVLDKNDKTDRKVMKNPNGRLRSGIFLNRFGFFVSFLLILTANSVMINATLVSTGCIYPE